MLTNHLSLFVAHYGNVAVFLLSVLESACIPIPSEVVLPYAGYLVHSQVLNFWSIVVIATIANLVGGSIAYAVGRFGGRAFIERYGRYILLNRKHLQKAEHWFEKYGEITVFLGRLLPAIRTFISLPAGVARMPFGKFIVFSLIGSLPWNLGLTYAGLQLANNWSTIDRYMKPFSYIGAVILIVCVVWFWFGRRRKTV